MKKKGLWWNKESFFLSFKLGFLYLCKKKESERGTKETKKVFSTQWIDFDTMISHFFHSFFIEMSWWEIVLLTKNNKVFIFICYVTNIMVCKTFLENSLVTICNLWLYIILITVRYLSFCFFTVCILLLGKTFLLHKWMLIQL